MRYNGYCVEDVVSKQFSPPFFVMNEGVARRQFRSMMQNVHKIDVESFKLYHVGWFETDTCEFKITRRVEVDTSVIQYELPLKEAVK